MLRERESSLPHMAAIMRERRDRFRITGGLGLRPSELHYRRRCRRLQSDRRQLGEELTLSAAQLCIARQSAFVSWPKLVAEIRLRTRDANSLKMALGRGDTNGVRRLTHARPMSLLDVGCVAASHLIPLLLEHGPKRIKEAPVEDLLLAAVAQRQSPAALVDCLPALLQVASIGSVDYAVDIIHLRQRAAESHPARARDVDAFEEALSLMSSYLDVPECDYMTEDD